MESFKKQAKDNDKKGKNRLFLEFKTNGELQIRFSDLISKASLSNIDDSVLDIQLINFENSNTIELNWWVKEFN